MTTTEPAIRANEREALRLFERGVAAARGGQRRVAAGLLARAVQLNPRHEASWLWLSGTLEDPSEIAFCLRSVLAINPQNERALRGLDWLEQHSARAASPASPPADAPAPEAADAPAAADDEAQAGVWWRRAAEQLRTPRPVSADAVIAHELQAHAHGESWWVNFRRSRRDLGRARLFLWSVPLLLLMMTLALNTSLRTAVARNESLAQAAALAAVRPTAAPAAPAAPAELLMAELPAHDDARALRYLSALSEPRARLRQAVAEYRAATSRPGGSSTTHAAAARRLRDAIDESYTLIERLEPPLGLSQAHAYYLSGLEMELAALDDMLEFYSSFSVENANRATVRMAEADRYLERARSAFDQRAVLVDTTAITGFTLR